MIDKDEEAFLHLPPLDLVDSSQGNWIKWIAAKPKCAPSEWTDWVKQAASRDKVGKELLGDYMDSLRRQTIRNVLSNSR